MNKIRVIIGSLIFNIVYWSIFILSFAILSPAVVFINYKKLRKIIYSIESNSMLFLLRFLLNIKYEVDGLENINGQVIIGANHQSTWETIAIPHIINNTENLTVVVKQELEDALLIGYYMKRFKYIAVHTDSPVKSIKRLYEEGERAKRDGDSILIFVTGARTKFIGDDADNIEDHKVGVYALYKKLNLPVVPCVMDSGKCWGRRAFIKKPGTIRIVFKKQIDAGLSREQFDNRLRESMLNLKS